MREAVSQTAAAEVLAAGPPFGHQDDRQRHDEVGEGVQLAEQAGEDGDEPADPRCPEAMHCCARRPARKSGMSPLTSQGR